MQHSKLKRTGRSSEEGISMCSVEACVIEGTKFFYAIIVHVSVLHKPFYDITGPRDQL
jgi:hypothetical protein